MSGETVSYFLLTFDTGIFFFIIADFFCNLCIVPLKKLLLFMNEK